MIDPQRPRTDPSPRLLFELSYEELRRIARRRRLAGHGADEAQISALVHETYIRFRRRWRRLAPGAAQDRELFIRILTLMMKSVAIDRRRRRVALRRGAGRVRRLSEREPADPRSSASPDPSTVLALDVALDALRSAHPNWFDVLVERYLLGRSHRETASRLGIAPPEVRRRRRLGLAWMRRSMEAGRR